MNTITKVIWFALPLLFLVVFNGFGQETDQVFYLKDGSTIQGKIIAQDDSTLVVETQFGTLEIRKSAVVRQEPISNSIYREEHTLYLKDGTILKGFITSEDDDTIRVETLDGVMVIPKSGVRQIDAGQARKVDREAAAGSQPQEVLPAQESELAQSSRHPGFEVLGGLAVPVGDFASTDQSPRGYAQTSVTLGLRSNGPISKYFWLGLVGLLSFHPLDETVVTRRIHSEFPGSTVDMGSYFLAWALADLSCNIALSPSVIFSNGVLFGGLLSKMPEITVSYENREIFQRSASSFAFGYGFSTGLIINRKVDLSFRYLTGKPQYTIETNDEYFEPCGDELELGTSILVFTLGFLVR